MPSEGYMVVDLRDLFAKKLSRNDKLLSKSKKMV